MSGTHGMPALSDDDFDAIAEAVAETARGRWFLAEFARRNRNADTNLLLDAFTGWPAAVWATATSPRSSAFDPIFSTWPRPSSG